MNTAIKLGALVGAALLVPSVSLASQPLLFPTRAEALPNDVYMTTSGHAFTTNAIDFSALRWDAGSTSWQASMSGTSAPATNEDHAAFGLPIYASEDGYVIACFESMPDNTDPSSNYCDTACPLGMGTGMMCDSTCASGKIDGGNHIVVVSSDDDHIVSYLHLEQGSIPDELCPNPNTFLDKTKQSCSAGLGSGYYLDARLDLLGLPSLPQVKKGQRIGRLGHSGNSTGPHCHIQVKPYTYDNVTNQGCEGDSEPIAWYETWIQARTPGVAPTTAWTKMNGAEIPDGPTNLIWPDPIGARQDTLGYGHAASHLHTVSHSSGEVMAYIDEGDDLELRSYHVGNDGSLVDQHLRQEGAASDVALARPNSSRNVIVGARISNNTLKFIPYTVDASGTITRQVGKERSEGTIGMLEMTKPSTHEGFVVAIQDGLGSLKVIDYTTDAALNITRNLASTGSGGAIDDVAITSTHTAFDGVVTAEVASTGFVVLRSFEVPASGGVFGAEVFTTFRDAVAVDIDTVSVLFGLGEVVVTSSQLSSGALMLDTWLIDGVGDITWVDAESSGAVHGFAAGAEPLGELLTAVRDSSDDLKLISWALANDGQIRRSGTRDFGGVGELFVHASADDWDSVIVTLIDSSDELSLISLAENFTSTL